MLVANFLSKAVYLYLIPQKMSTWSFFLCFYNLEALDSLIQHLIPQKRDKNLGSNLGPLAASRCFIDCAIASLVADKVNGDFRKKWTRAEKNLNRNIRSKKSGKERFSFEMFRPKERKKEMEMK